MNLREASGSLRALAFRISRAITGMLPGGRISSFGGGADKIGSILIINLDRQPQRWRRVQRELRRFQTSCGAPLASIVRRLAAVDARDGRAVAATADVDSTYRVGHQLYVQPDARLEECFEADEPVRMTRQEVAVARSHVEAWKAVAAGSDDYVLVLEDDVWFRFGAAAAIDRGWRAAVARCRERGGPRMLYLSYADAGGTATRMDACDALFRPVRGLWYLSGYVLSRAGAATLLSAMPVVGPVDLWINYRFEQLGALALSSPAILQREDSPSDNSYSILPYLARAGTIDAGSSRMRPERAGTGRVIAWTAGREREGLAMALSMLGLRVRCFDGNEEAMSTLDLAKLFEVFDAVVDARLLPDAISAAVASASCKFLVESSSALPEAFDAKHLSSSRLLILSDDMQNDEAWEPLCTLLGLAHPVQPFPVGAHRDTRLFRDDRPHPVASVPIASTTGSQLDDSPWVLPPEGRWQSRAPSNLPLALAGEPLLSESMTTASASFRGSVETFPGNLATFTRQGLVHGKDGALLTVSKAITGNRPYRSGALVSDRLFERGRFEAEIRPASGAGLLTGFFLHRDAPRQEIDIEFAGHDPRRMLINVYFNPGDDGAAIGFGYRGSPHRVDLGFDATADFHHYAIDWRAGQITWSVDGVVVHERVGWDPTPLPHLPMRLHANLWVPRSEELAGRLHEALLPASAAFRNVSVRS